MSDSAKKDQFLVLKYLYDRLTSSDDRYCTIPTILKNSGIDASNQYILALTDDLEASGYAITRQAYSMRGGRLFQITAAGVDLIESGGRPSNVDSATWTGKFNLSVYQIAQIRSKLTEIRAVVESSKMTNSQRANALAIVQSVEMLIETPDPLWPIIMRLLRSPILGNITGVTGLVYVIVQTLLEAASS